MPPKQNLAPSLVIRPQNASQGHTLGFRSIVFKVSMMFSCFLMGVNFAHPLSPSSLKGLCVIFQRCPARSELWDLRAKRLFEADRQQLNSTHSNYNPVTGRWVLLTWVDELSVRYIWICWTTAGFGAAPSWQSIVSPLWTGGILQSQDKHCFPADFYCGSGNSSTWFL